MERRDLVKILSAAAVAGRLEGAALQFFTAAEGAVVEGLAEVILPADGASPGAKDAGVIRYIDLIVKYGDGPLQQAWRNGVAAVEGEARRRFDAGFAALSSMQQDQIVATMAKDEGQRTDELGRFFTAVKRLSMEAYHYSAVHWQKNFGRGVNTAMPEFQGCDHKHL